MLWVIHIENIFFEIFFTNLYFLKIWTIWLLLSRILNSSRFQPFYHFLYCLTPGMIDIPLIVICCLTPGIDISFMPQTCCADSCSIALSTFNVNLYFQTQCRCLSFKSCSYAVGASKQRAYAYTQQTHMSAHTTHAHT